jgi:hypothetical protein
MCSGAVVNAAARVGQFGDQLGVIFGGLGGLDLVELGLEGFGLVVTLGELVGDVLAHGLGCGAASLPSRSSWVISPCWTVSFWLIWRRSSSARWRACWS